MIFIEGLFLLIVSQTVFMVCGFITNLGLARIFGPETYGTYSLVNSILTWAQLFVMSGIPFALQKFVSETPEAAHSIKRIGLRIQSIYTLLVSVLLFGFSTLVAKLFQDSNLEPYIRIVALNVFIFGLYRFTIGFQNGLRRFRIQALIIIVFSVVRLAVIFILVFAGFSIRGALLGTIVGVMAGLSVGIWFSRGKSEGASVDVKRLLRFAVPNIVYVVLVNVIFWLDLWFVRYFHGNAEAGYFNAAGMISKMPNFIVMALSWIMLPLISGSIHRKERERTRELISQSLRFFFLLFVPIIFIVLSTSQQLISLIYSDAYIAGAQSLRILIVGLFFLTLFIVINNILMADNRIGILSVLTCLMIVLDVVLNRILVPSHGLTGAAWATTTTALIGAFTVGWMVIRRFGILVPVGTVIRALVAAVILFGLSSVIQARGLMLLVEYVLIAVLYLGVLLMLGEIGSRDLEALKGMIVRMGYKGNRSK